MRSGHFIIARVPNVTRAYRKRYITHYQRYIYHYCDKRHRRNAKFHASRLYTVYSKDGDEYCLWFIVTARARKDAMNVYLLDSRFELENVTQWASRHFDDLSVYSDRALKTIRDIGKMKWVQGKKNDWRS
jgi:hypothetical protein